ncbi:hypothetical protein BHM03_00048163, partial [Ensete ventricosum]
GQFAILIGIRRVDQVRGHSRSGQGGDHSGIENLGRCNIFIRGPLVASGRPGREERLPGAGTRGELPGHLRVLYHSVGGCDPEVRFQGGHVQAGGGGGGGARCARHTAGLCHAGVFPPRQRKRQVDWKLSSIIPYHIRRLPFGVGEGSAPMVPCLSSLFVHT